MVVVKSKWSVLLVALQAVRGISQKLSRSFQVLLVLHMIKVVCKLVVDMVTKLGWRLLTTDDWLILTVLLGSLSHTTSTDRCGSGATLQVFFHFLVSL